MNTEYQLGGANHSFSQIEGEGGRKNTTKKLKAFGRESISYVRTFMVAKMIRCGGKGEANIYRKREMNLIGGEEDKFLPASHNIGFL